MDHELKQRLIGAVVITALSAIFIPMLFDDPVDNSAKTIAEMTAPPAPTANREGTDNLPSSKSQVLNDAEPELKVSEVDDHQTASGATAQAVSPVDKDLLAKSAKTTGTGSDVAENQAVTQDELVTTPGLDTGDIIPPDEGESDSVDATAMPKTKKSAQQDEEAVSKVKSSANEKAKPKKVVANEKAKAVDGKQDKDANGKLARWSLQAGSFSKKENAQAVLEKLRKQGLPATMVNKGNLYRIKIGPELDKKKAMEMRSKLASQKIQSYLQSE